MDSTVTPKVDGHICQSQDGDDDESLWNLLPWFLLALTSMVAILLVITLLVMLKKNNKLQRYRVSERRGRLASNAGSVACSDVGSTRRKPSTSHWVDRYSDAPNSALQKSGDFSRYSVKKSDDGSNKRKRKSNIGAWDASLRDASYRRSMSVDHIDLLGLNTRNNTISMASIDSFEPAEYANMADAPNGRGPPDGRTLPDPEAAEGAVYRNINVNTLPNKGANFFANKPGLVQHPFFAQQQAGSAGTRETVRMSGIVPARTPERKMDRTRGARQEPSESDDPYLIMQNARM